MFHLGPEDETYLDYKVTSEKFPHDVIIFADVSIFRSDVIKIRQKLKIR